MIGKFNKLLSRMGFHIEEEAGGIDLVCGMDIPRETKYKVVFRGKKYFFCSETCKNHFELDPEKYIG